MDAYFKLKFFEEIIGFVFVVAVIIFMIWQWRR